MGSKGGSDQVQRSEPWAAQAPFLQDTFNQAQNLYYSGGPQYFPGATYVPFSEQTEQGLGLTEQRALAGSPVTDAAQGFATSVLSSNPNFAGGLNYLSGGPGLGEFANFAGAQGLDASLDPFLSQLTGMPQATQNALTQTAQGQSLTGNPYLDEQFGIASQKVTDVFNRDVLPGISAQFSLAGRTGSDAMQDVQLNAAGQVSDSLAQLANSIYGGNYQRERDRQLQAAGQLGSLSQAQQGLGLQAVGQGANLDLGRLGLAGSLYGQQQANQLGAGGLDANIYGQQLGAQTGLAGLANSLANQDYADINKLLGVGGAVEGLSQSALQDQMNRFNYYQNLPQQNLANYIAALQGNYGGTVTQEGQGGSPLQGAAGGALAGSALGPWGALAGGVLGLLG